MLTARVEGTVVATVKNPKFTGVKLLLVRAWDKAPRGALMVAADRTGQAGIGDLVTCATSGEGAAVFGASKPPCDLAISGFVDEYGVREEP
jgi:microcompartment protein CcmK/EutM